MNRFIIVLLTIFLGVSAMADDYKILKMNTSSVRIGHRVCKIGDVFSDKSVIHWTSDKQAIKAQNIKTKEIRLFVMNDFLSKGSKTVKEYYLKNNHLSTRGALMGLDDLAEILPDTLYLWDDINFESPYQLDEESFFYLNYNRSDDSIVTKELKADKNHFSIRREDFYSDGVVDTISVSLHYVDKRWNENSLVKDSINVVLIPDNE